MNENRQLGWGSIALHWIVAALVIWLFWSGQQLEGAVSREVKLPMVLLHNSIGVLLIVSALIRTVVRLKNGMPPMPVKNFKFDLFAALVRWSLLVLILVIIISGVLTWWFVEQPVSFFGLFDIPSPFARNMDLHHQTETLHSVSGHLIVPFVVLHVLGALKHLFYDRDGVFRRIIIPADAKN